MKGRGRPTRRGVGALVAAGLLLGVAMTGEPAVPRLLVMDLPYARVWEGAVRALSAYPITRAADGVIETARMERPARPAEAPLVRVAERVTVRVEAMADKVTRITVTVETEALRDGRWEAVESSPDTARAVLDRIRASVG
jgi:hypothetical protein